jgi:hypothetical protein
MKVFSRDIMICGTAYVRAENADAAELLFQGMRDTSLEFSEGSTGDHEISGAHLDSPSLPDESFSPAMSVVGPVVGGAPELQHDSLEDQAEAPPSVPAADEDYVKALPFEKVMAAAQ